MEIDLEKAPFPSASLVIFSSVESVGRIGFLSYATSVHLSTGLSGVLNKKKCFIN